MPSINKELIYNATKTLNFNSVVFMERDFWSCWILKKIQETLSNTPSENFSPLLSITGDFAATKAYNITNLPYPFIEIIISSDQLGITDDIESLSALNPSESEKKLNEIYTKKSKYIIDSIYEPLLNNISKEIEKDWSLTTSKPLNPKITFDYPKNLPGMLYSQTPEKLWINFYFTININKVDTQKYHTQKPTQHVIKPFMTIPNQNECAESSYFCEGSDMIFLQHLLWTSALANMPENDVFFLIRRKLLKPEVFYGLNEFYKKNLYQSALNTTNLTLDIILKHQAFFMLDPTWLPKNFQKPDIKIVPSEYILRNLEEAYNSQIETLSGNRPSFHEVIENCGKLEYLVNQS